VPNENCPKPKNDNLIQGKNKNQTTANFMRQNTNLDKIALLTILAHSSVLTDNLLVV